MSRQSAVRMTEDSTDVQHRKWRTSIVIIVEQGWRSNQSPRLPPM